MDDKIMKTALVCIAKNEDRYIDEWIAYHLKLGFDKIFIIRNNWRCSIKKDPRVKIVKINISGVPPQMPAYNYILDNMNEYYKDYDHIAFLDVDEFLVIKKHNSIGDFLLNKNSHIGINWVLFGDNGLEDDGSCGVLSRFTKRQKGINEHVKCIIKNNEGAVMITPHNPNQQWLGSDGQMHHGPFCPNGNDEEAQINHYSCKTRGEWINKKNRGRADALTHRT